MKKQIALAVAAIFAAQGAMATNIMVVDSTGDVQIAQPGQAAKKGAVGSPVLNSATVSTGADGRALIRFDDGQTIALANNSSVRVANYVYTSSDPQAGRSVIDFLRGGLRFITGAVGKTRHENVAIRAQQVTIGIRGTDFVMADGPNGLNISVNEGGVTASNSAGSIALDAGQTAVAPGPSVPPSSAPAGATPPSVQSIQSQLAATNMAAGPAVGPGIGAVGAAGAVGASAGTLTLITIGAVVLGAAAAAGSHGGGSGGSTTPPPSGTTGTH